MPTVQRLRYLLITGRIQVTENYYLIFNIKNGYPFWVSVFSCYGLAATAVVVAAATVIGCVTATAAATEDEDKNDYPRTVISTKVTHLRKPPFLFSSHTMQVQSSVLQGWKKFFKKQNLTFPDFRV